jgi:hypothetical protein
MVSISDLLFKKIEPTFEKKKQYKTKIAPRFATRGETRCG